MTKIITICEVADSELLRNHQHYAQLYGYTHQWVETGFMAHARLRTAYKYNYVLQQLKACAEGELLLMLDGHTAIFCPLSIEEAMAGRDTFVCLGPETAGVPCLPLNNFLVLRNTAANREILHRMLIALHGVLAGQEHHVNEFDFLREFGMLPTNAVLLDTYINVRWTIANWFNAKIFAVGLGMHVGYNAAGEVTDDMTHDRNLERMLLQRINATLIHGAPIMQLPDYPALSDDAVSHYNPQAKIALVTLYTHHITSYARVSEHNVKRYCDRHGYAYHVYRAIPEGVPDNIMGSWLKPHVLSQHFAQHDWVIWVDADVLFHNQAQKLEPLLDGRELLFAKDLCGWPINSGVQGFKNTPVNAQLLAQLCQRMNDVQDKSGIYSELGDQHHIINVLTEQNQLSEASVSNCLSINTPPQLANAETLLTHYVGWGDPYRSIYMAHDDAISLRRG
ncbi:MAG: galactosyl transferase GMA12/MNN10 family protein [Formosimonas sp.]